MTPVHFFSKEQAAAYERKQRREGVPVSAARAGTGLAPTRASVRQEQARFREAAPRRRGDTDTPAVASQTCHPAVPRLAGTSSAGRGSV